MLAFQGCKVTQLQLRWLPFDIDAAACWHVLKAA
jgi:hypothetical protein